MMMKPAPIYPLLLSATLFVVSCSSDPLERVAMEASRQGTLANQAGTTAGVEAGAKVTEHYYWVAKYEATREQREIAAARGKLKAQSIISKAKAAGRTPPKYIAVKTKSDSRAKTSTSVMIWNTQSEEIVGNNVYDIDQPPSHGAMVRFETFSAPYVGS